MLRRLGWALAASSLAVASTGSCSPAPPPPTEDVASSSAPVTGGADTDLYPFAVSVCVPPTTKNNCNACSGTLIAPNLVMTARHCLFQTPSQVDCATSTFGSALGAENAIWVGTSSNSLQSGVGWHLSKKVFVPTKAGACGNDIALVVLADMIPSAEATPVEPAVRYPLSDHARYASDFTVLGYGLTNGCTGSAGRRRIRENIRVRCMVGDPLLACPSGQAPEEMIVGAGLCPGDSGSGDFEQTSFDSGKPVVFGISVRSGGGHIGISTRTDAWRDLIVEAANFAAADQGYPPPPWTAAPPPPPPKDAGADAKVDSGGGGADAGERPIEGPGGRIGDACVTAGDCVEGACILQGSAGVCTRGCDPKAPACGDGEVCSAVEDVFVCRKGTPRTVTTETGGCRAAPGASSGPGAAFGGVAVGLALLAVARRRRAS